MALLEKLGLAKRKARPVGQSLEKGRSAERRSPWQGTLGKVVIFVALLLLTLAAFPRGDMYDYLLQVGDEWRQETLVAPFDFPVYKTDEEIEADRREVRFKTPPYFREVADAQERIAANRDTVAAQLDRILSTYSSYRYNQLFGMVSEAARDSAQYFDMRRYARVKLTPEQWRQLADWYVSGQPEPFVGVPPEGTRVDRQLLQAAWEFGAQLLTIGVMDVPLDTVVTEQIIIRDEEERQDNYVDKSRIYGLDEAYEAADREFTSRFEGAPERAAVAFQLFRAVFQPSLEYLQAETLAELQRKERRIAPTRGAVQAGEIIVNKGQQVTPDIKRRLTSLHRAEIERGGRSILWKLTLGQFLLTFSTYLLFFLYLFLLRRQIFNDNRHILLVSLLFAGIVGLYAITLRLPEVAMMAVPVAIVSIVLTVMFDSRVGILGTLTLALVGGHLLGYDFEFAFATVVAGIMGVFSVRDIKNRGQFFVSAGLVFMSYMVVLVATWLVFDSSVDRFLNDLLLIAINSFLILMAYPLLWVFERAFDITTDLSLLELSDTNRPLLKELSLRAPGTFNHSLQVANLAEAAADSIGANALLTRVGALYHDVGKMLKPEYFVENQRPGDNPHDHLKPRMSALIIASHVKEGLELGRQYNLPRRVLIFVPMHHGTTRIEYFYRKALEQRGPEEPPVHESEFRYPGPRPSSKETGILMLADSVEAASRSLADPTHKRLETLIEMIFKARIEDGQLDQTDLTFRELNTIKDTFLSMLLGIYHVRVKYPGQREREREPSQSGVIPQPVSGVVGIPEQSIGMAEEQEEPAPATSGGAPETRSSDEAVEEDGEESRDGEQDSSEELDTDPRRRSGLPGDGGSLPADPAHEQERKLP